MTTAEFTAEELRERAQRQAEINFYCRMLKFMAAFFTFWFLVLFFMEEHENAVAIGFIGKGNGAYRSKVRHYFLLFHFGGTRMRMLLKVESPLLLSLNRTCLVTGRRTVL